MELDRYSLQVNNNQEVTEWDEELISVIILLYIHLAT